MIKKNMQHSFDVDIATKYGLLEAILLNNLWYWIKKNEANKVNCFENDYWTYNSIRAFGELFPYVSKKQILKALKHLENEGLIKTGNFNKSTYDRTLWYAFDLKGKSIMPKSQMEDTKMSNGLVENVKPIPNINTNINTNTNKEIYKESFEELWKLYPNKKGKAEAYKKFTKAIKEGVKIETIKEGIEKYNNYIEIEHIKPQYIKNGSTWFNQKCWEDDYSINRKPTTKDIANKINFMNFLKEEEND